MADTYDDFYHQKTDAELQFFVDHPELYQPPLVDAARAELRQRGKLIVPPPTAVYADAMLAPTRGRPIGLLTLGLAVLLLASLGAVYFMRQKSRAATEAAAPPPRPKAPPKLETVETSAMPDYGGAVAAAITEQLARVPAAEQAPEMDRRQYRELAKRFWTAEFQTEYVDERARQGKMDAFLPGHVETALATWEQWNKATRYGYKFGPKMTQHFDAMANAARQQQEGLEDLLLVARNPQPYETPRTREREADVNDLLSSLLRKSPVTGRPYVVLVRKVQL
ncbi:MAG: hypothetical protein M3Y54_16780 [Bacteroidota bacterium]|nr:hypothetical protein [Bacteroidota bacterium]